MASPIGIEIDTAGLGRGRGAGRLRSGPLGSRHWRLSERRSKAAARRAALAPRRHMFKPSAAAILAASAARGSQSEPTRSYVPRLTNALGNTALVEGDIAGAVRSYDECVGSTARGAALEAVRRDAAINRKFALAQPQSLSAPQDNSSDDRSKSQNPDRRKGARRQGNGDGQSPEGGPENDPASGGEAPEAEGDRDRRRPAADDDRQWSGLPPERQETRRMTDSTPHSSTSGTPSTEASAGWGAASASDDRKDW